MFRSLRNVLLLVGRNGFETFKRMPARVVSRCWNITQHSTAQQSACMLFRSKRSAVDMFNRGGGSLLAML